jgi:transcription-repair coupling factor (superfamily II helicase)
LKGGGIGLKRFLTNAVRQTHEYQQISNSIENGHHVTAINGIWENAAAVFLLALMEDHPKNYLIIGANDSEAKAFYEAAFAMDPTVSYFPTKDLVLFDAYAHSHETLNERIRCLRQLIFDSKPRMLVTSVEALMTKLPPKALWEEAQVKLAVGDDVVIADLLKKLMSMGYVREELVTNPGSFSLRGGIVDLFPVGEELPYRMELFDTEVDSLRTFDPATQLSLEKCQELVFGPATELLMNETLHHRLSQKVKKALKKASNDEWVERLESLLDYLDAGIYPSNLDKFYGLAFEENSYGLLDYLSENDSVVLLDNGRIKERYGAAYNSFLDSYKDHLEREKACKDQLSLAFTYTELLKQIENKQIITVDAISKRIPDFKIDEMVSVQTMESPLYHGKLEHMIDDLKQWLYKGYKVTIALGSESKCKNVEAALREEKVSYLEGSFEKPQSGMCYFLQEDLKHGFQLAASKFVLLTDKELFGTPYRKKTPSGNKKKGQMIKSFTELSVGSLVVHENHGIARYVGLEQLVVDGLKRDYLKLNYSGEVHLYIPVENMDAIQKYIGAEETEVKLSRLGSGEWQRAKARVKKSIEDMTEDLIKLYADRQSRRGHAYSSDTDWQKNFEEMFPYEETQDQLKCIAEIKRDMEQELCMERLLCGDVGYGKTEVAIRAVFKAAMDGKQVAFLVPTTILAQQHYSNLVSRFSKFPIKVEMLSRFRTKKQQDQIIEDLRTGVVDVVVGTHRILSKDVVYKDLGLLIIDEEQRFRVKHKEAIKQMKVNVDVLTLTATPIPRTLHMSLIGIRDMSVLEDPPEDRYPIQTYVVEFDELLAKDWINREVDRGGQAFFVHNRVQDIDHITSRLRELLPDVRIDYAHGQMSETKLEKIMLSFLNHEFDVLVCTTIIETGLDISNVNTIIINEADKMGLSQLYQLRGRVGRSNRIAYAYLTYQKNKVLSEIAEKRLKAIKEFTELGAGFKIAMKDLEIRGAGNLLGSDQHGHMASVGYEMFCKLLEEQVRRIKGEAVENFTDTTIEISINAFIPEQYIAQPEQKLDMYKRISSIRNQEDKYRVEEELEDRYGTMPQAVYNLLSIAYVKALSQKIGVGLIKEHEEHVNLYFVENPQVGPELVIKATDLVGKRIAFVMTSKPYMKFKFSKLKLTKEKKIGELENFLSQLTSDCKTK